MKLTIAGLHTDTGNSLRNHCEEKMLGLKKYFEQVIDVDISLKEERGLHLAEVTVHASGIHLRALGEGDDFYVAVSDAALKLERQLQRYKGRLQKHRKRRQTFEDKFEALEGMDAVSQVLEEEALDDLPEGEEWLSDYAPMVTRKEVTHIEPMNVDEAIMQMDLLHKPAFLFQNSDTGVLNVVYRDSDGSVRWVSPK